MALDEGAGPGTPEPGGAAARGSSADDATPEAEGTGRKLLQDRPTILGLARLSQRPGLAPGEENAYRRIAQLVEIDASAEFLVAPCDRGLTTQFLAGLTGAAGSGVDPDAELVELATERTREAGLADKLHFDTGELTDLPYKDEIFDLVIGDVGLAACADPAAAVAELARVTQPMGGIVLLQPVWNRAVEAERRESLVEHLGVRPLLLVEWKQMLRDAGVVELFVEDLVDAANPWQPLLGMAASTDLPTVRDRISLLHRAWQQWGLRGLGQSIAGGQELRRLITRERLLGLALIKGTRWHGGDDAAKD